MDQRRELVSLRYAAILHVSLHRPVNYCSHSVLRLARKQVSPKLLSQGSNAMAHGEKAGLVKLSNLVASEACRSLVYRPNTKSDYSRLSLTAYLP